MWPSCNFFVAQRCPAYQIPWRRGQTRENPQETTTASCERPHGARMSSTSDRAGERGGGREAGWAEAALAAADSRCHSPARDSSPIPGLGHRRRRGGRRGQGSANDRRGAASFSFSLDFFSNPWARSWAAAGGGRSVGASGRGGGERSWAGTGAAAGGGVAWRGRAGANVGRGGARDEEEDERF